MVVHSFCALFTGRPVTRFPVKTRINKRKKYLSLITGLNAESLFTGSCHFIISKISVALYNNIDADASDAPRSSLVSHGDSVPFCPRAHAACVSVTVAGEKASHPAFLFFLRAYPEILSTVPVQRVLTHPRDRVTVMAQARNPLPRRAAETVMFLWMMHDLPRLRF